MQEKEQIEKIITEDINPYLAMHQGGCELLSYEEGVVSLRMFGGCSGCPSSQITLFNGIVPIFKEKMPEIKDVILEN
ncbi:MAG: NifU family protein [Oligoflexales bacterium]|nr:NifU family protein [Oligoflexales bacterium]